MTSKRIGEFLTVNQPRTPYLVIDLDIIRERYLELQRAFPDTKIYYSVKANHAPEVIRALAGLGAAFDVASPGQISLCLAEGVPPESISYGNTIKKPDDIAFAYEHGVTLFTTDSLADIAAIASRAPGSRIFCRVTIEQAGAAFPLGLKFGCRPDTAVALLAKAASLGLNTRGVSFHVGSQQTDPAAWVRGISVAAEIGDRLGAAGIELPELNLGGGLPVGYRDAVPDIADFAGEIITAVRRQFPSPPRLVIEPGRVLVADSGVIRAQVVMVTRKSEGDERRWVYLDVGRHNGLAETIDEVIAYRLSTRYSDSEPSGPVTLAGPTCDGCDVLYESTPCRLPLALKAGDYVDVLSAGAYTAVFSTAFFNGFPALPTYCIGDTRP